MAGVLREVQARRRRHGRWRRWSAGRRHGIAECLLGALSGGAGQFGGGARARGRSAVLGGSLGCTASVSLALDGRSEEDHEAGAPLHGPGAAPVSIWGRRERAVNARRAAGEGSNHVSKVGKSRA